MEKARELITQALNSGRKPKVMIIHDAPFTLIGTPSVQMTEGYAESISGNVVYLTDGSVSLRSISQVDGQSVK